MRLRTVIGASSVAVALAVAVAAADPDTATGSGSGSAGSAAPGAAIAPPTSNPWSIRAIAGTDFPIDIGAGIEVEGPFRIRLSSTVGIVPGVYVDTINAFLVGIGAYNHDTANLIKSALDNSLIWRTHVGWRPWSRHGFYGMAGYGLVTLGGGATGSEIIEAATGKSLPATDTTMARSFTCTSTLHMLDAETRLGVARRRALARPRIDRRRVHGRGAHDDHAGLSADRAALDPGLHGRRRVISRLDLHELRLLARRVGLRGLRLLMRLAVTAAALASCGTPSHPPADPLDNHAAAAVIVPATELDEITLARGACLGNCPVYAVTIHHDGRIEWTGEANVVVTGHAEAHVDRGALDQIAVALDASRFFERDRDGKLPPPPCPKGEICLGTISTCSDTSHTTISVMRGAQLHVVDDRHCSQDPDLARLEALIGDLANTAPWIGR